MKKWLGLFMACCLTLSSNPAVYGQQANSSQQVPVFKDLSGHWAGTAAARMHELGLMQGDGRGDFRPNDGISRAEFATVLYRIFGFTGEGSSRFEDVTADDWYYEAMMRANGSGIIQGTDQTRLSPRATITREDAAVMIDRAFQLSTGDGSGEALKQFQDANAVAGYASKAISYLTGEGIIQGYNGKLSPKSPITRAEAAVMLSGMIGEVVKSPGVHRDFNVEGNVIVRTAGVSLNNIQIQGNLILAEGIGEGDIHLDGVKVTGTVLIKGGGSHSVVISNSELGRVVIDKNGQPVRMVFLEGNQVRELLIMKKALIEQSQNSSFGGLTVAAEAAGTELKLQGVVDNMVIEAEGVSLNGTLVESGYSGSRTADTAQQPGPGTSTSPASGGSSGGGGTPGGSNPVPLPDTEKPVAPTTIEDSKWELAWHDEFDGGSIDSSIWNVENTGMVYNNELQYYSPKNVSLVKDGKRSVLKIEAKKGGYGTKDYSSGKLTTKQKRDWTYGKVVVRAKLPQQQGMWPAIWMMPTDEAHYGGWPASGEIDIMEMLGGAKGNGNPSKTYSTIHYDSVQPDESHGHQQGTYTLPGGVTFADDYHDFQLEWLPGKLRFYVDGHLVHDVDRWMTKAPGQPEYYTYPAPFDRDFYLILNLAVGGDWPGAPDSDFASDSMKVDFVRVYTYKDLASWPDVTGKLPALPALEPQRDPQPDGNLLYNDGFAGEVSEDGVPAEWEFLENENGSGTIRIVDDAVKGKAAKMTIQEAGTQLYSLQLTQKPLFIEKNKKYRVSFDAKADTHRSIMSKVTQFEGSWTAYSGEKTFNLTTDWTAYDYEFDMRYETDNNARFEFNAGKNNSTLYFTNVRIEEIGPAEPVEVERKPLSDLNLVYNGTFDQGEDRLAFWEDRIAEGAQADISVNNFRKGYIMERQLVVNTTVASTPESVVVAQPGLPLEANTTYALSFDAKAEGAGAMEIGLVSEGGHAVQFPAGKTVKLTDQLENYSYEIAVGEGTPNAKSELQLLFGGTEGGTVYVDNVRLVKRGNPVKVNGYAHIPAKEAWALNGLQLEDSEEGGQHVAYMGEGDLLRFKVSTANTADYVLSARVASGTSDSYIRLSIKDDQGQTVTEGTYELGETGGWQTYKTLYFDPVQLEADRSYYVDFEGYEYNTLWVDISENKIQNSKLAPNMGHWQTVTVTDSTYSAKGIVLQVPGGTTNWWDSQLQQNGISLEQGKEYRLEFDASSTIAKTLQVAAGLNVDPYTKYMEKAVQLTTVTQHYSSTIKMTKSSDPDAQLAFGLGIPAEGGVPHDITIGNVRLYEVNPAAEQGGQPQNVNLISNIDKWSSYSVDSGQLELKNDQGVLQAIIGTTGVNAWDRQLIYEGFGIQQGYKYALSFTAKAEKPRKIGAGVGWLGGAPDYAYTDYFANDIEVTDIEQTFTFNFDVTKAGNSNSRVSFNLGNYNDLNDGSNTVTITGVSLKNMGPVN